MKNAGAKTEITGNLIHLMFELRDELRRHMQQKFKEHGIDLTYEMHQIMNCLWKRDGVNQQELADLTLKDKASMTLLIDNLAKRGLVKRKEAPGDRRSKLVCLTAKGRQLGIKVEPWVEELFAIAGEGLPVATLRDCLRALGHMRDNVRQAAETPAP